MTPAALKPPGSSPGKPSPGHQVLLAGFALAVGGFGIGTGEFGIMGLLPDVAGDIGVSIPLAGHVSAHMRSVWWSARQ
jgi:DHA1 family inner membrane transport protein